MKKRITWIVDLVLVFLLVAGCGSMAETSVPTESASEPYASSAPEESGKPSIPATPGASTESTIPVSTPSVGSTGSTEATTPVETEPGPHTHAFSDWVQTKAPDCSREGSEERKCTCGETEIQKVAALGHAWDDGTVTNAPASCAETGAVTYRCRSCGTTRAEQISGDHRFDAWEYEAYTYILPAEPPHRREDSEISSHRQVRFCADCGYKETDGTPEHPCHATSPNREVTILVPGDCMHRDWRRSTCKICGWATEFEGIHGRHVWGETEYSHISDYGPYTNELDLEYTVCTLCDYQVYEYKRGQGFYEVDFSIRQYKFEFRNEFHWYERDFWGTAYSEAVSSLYQFEADDTEEETAARHILLHPDRQTVYRNPVYDSDGSLLQFDVSWYDTALEQSCTETVVVADIPSYYTDENNDFYENHYGDHPGRNPRYIISYYAGHLVYLTVLVSFSG